MRTIPVHTISDGAIKTWLAPSTLVDGRWVDPDPRSFTGIALSAEGKIVVGESGRGRSQIVLDPPPGSEVYTPKTYREDTSRFLKAIQTSRDEAAALILLRDHSGYRGGWCLREAPVSMCPNEGQLFADPQVPSLRAPCPECGSGDTDHRLLPRGEMSATDIGHVVAEGYCAQGDAGRMGGGPEYLLLARPGSFSISRAGRLYGQPRRLTVQVGTDGSVTVTNAEAEIMAASAAKQW